VPSEHAENPAPRRLDVVGRRLDLHAGFHARRARRDRLRATVDPHEAQAAFAVRSETLVVTERRDLDADRGKGVEDRRAVGDVTRPTVDNYPHAERAVFV
jgi:hypothetical protein